MLKKFVLMTACCLALPIFAQNRQAQQQDVARYYQEAINNMASQVRLLQDENARLDAKVNVTEQKLAALSRENKELRQEMEAIRQMLQKDAATREAQFREISRQLEILAKTPIPAPPPPPQQPTSVQPAQPGDLAPVSDGSQAEEYDIYVVQKGATLCAIATAYQVSVNDIKRANNLKNDLIREGQKLKIPRKK